MEIEQLIDQFLAQDPNLLVPVLAGCVIILGGLLIGIFRGMTGGVIVALLFGGVMTTSPILLGKVEIPGETVTTDTVDPARLGAEVAHGAAQLAVANSEAVTGLTRVVNSMRLAMEGLGPVLAPTTEGTESSGDTADVVARFTQSLDAAGTQLDQASASLDKINSLRSELESDMSELESALDGAPDGTATK
ncbi:hypothetical protein DLJ53_30250 [Acuticoccus sediminis]|uniref:Uncharacterized protein n=1 Tax=Acuticoccus sediminis TaxID=2184697 RepID=A0A8B2NHR8_9HYPH|nr:hypothetical protein [Acuticoccus sediminis]RAH96963.1 hypothetical protein DLJ53_30250 [Acuticoccus sediminis]